MKNKLSCLSPRTKRILLISLLLAVLLVPFSVQTYDDGGTVRIQSLTWTLMLWDRDLMTVDQDGNLIEAAPQKARIYFFPNNWKDYDALWEIAH